MSSDPLPATLPADRCPPRVRATLLGGQESLYASTGYGTFSLSAKMAHIWRARNFIKSTCYARHDITTSNDVCPFGGHIVDVKKTVVRKAPTGGSGGSSTARPNSTDHHRRRR